MDGGQDRLRLLMLLLNLMVMLVLVMMYTADGGRSGWQSRRCQVGNKDVDVGVDVAFSNDQHKRCID